MIRFVRYPEFIYTHPKRNVQDITKERYSWERGTDDTESTSETWVTLTTVYSSNFEQQWVTAETVYRLCYCLKTTSVYSILVYEYAKIEYVSVRAYPS